MKHSQSNKKYVNEFIQTALRVIKLIIQTLYLIVIVKKLINMKMDGKHV